MSEGPLLGLATTEEMLDELICRFDMERYVTTSLVGDDARLLCKAVKVVKAWCPESLLKYRTVSD